MSPTPTRGALGSAWRYSRATRSSVQIRRSCPQRRQARLGLRFRTGSQVKKLGPWDGSSTPWRSRPRHGRPSARERCHTTGGKVDSWHGWAGGGGGGGGAGGEVVSGVLASATDDAASNSAM